MRAGALGRHSSRVHDDARARERPPVRMRSLPDVRLSRAVLGHAIRRTELYRLPARTPRRPVARVPLAPTHVANVSSHESRLERAAMAVEVSRPFVDARRTVP